MPMISRRPRVVALIESWTPAAEELPQLRAQLRGLGAELAVVASRGAWCLAPDDELAVLDAEAHAEAVALRAGPGDAIYVLDGDGAIRFSHATDTVLSATLGQALASAGEAVLATPRFTCTRREWALMSLCTGFALALFGCKDRHRDAAAPSPPVAPAREYDIVLDVNGTRQSLRVDARTSLLDALRERLGLTGTKKGCDHGQCGACTVHLDGQRVVSCMVLAVMAQHKRITTIEGIAHGDELHPMQAAFIKHDGFQCGYCTPGQIMSAIALVAEGRAKTDAEIRELMSGNLCRCGAYPNIIAAIQTARKGA